MKYNNIYIEKGDKHIVHHPSEYVKKTVTLYKCLNNHQTRSKLVMFFDFL